MTTGIVLQVNMGPGGLPNLPVPRIRVTRDGVEGDRHTNPRPKGRDHAVLVVAREWLDRLAKEGYEVYPGALGENLTVEGVDFAHAPPGTRFRAGNVLLRVTEARKPCMQVEVYGAGMGKRIYNARIKSGDATDPAWGSSGLLCAVEEEGVVEPGHAIELLPA